MICPVPCLSLADQLLDLSHVWEHTSQSHRDDLGFLPLVSIEQERNAQKYVLSPFLKELSIVLKCLYCSIQPATMWQHFIPHRSGNTILYEHLHCELLLLTHLMLLRYFCSCRKANFSGFLENPPRPILKKALRSRTLERKGTAVSSVGTSPLSSLSAVEAGSVCWREAVSPAAAVAVSCS